MLLRIPKYFFVKKYILLSLCGLYIVLLAVYPLIANKIGDHELSANTKGLYEHDHEEILWWDTMYTMILFSAVGVVIQLFGLLAIWNEHFYLLWLYLVFQLVLTVSNLIHAFHKSAIVALVITLFALYYLGDLFMLRQDLKLLKKEQERKRDQNYYLNRNGSLWTIQTPQQQMSIVSETINTVEFVSPNQDNAQ